MDSRRSNYSRATSYNAPAGSDPYMHSSLSTTSGTLNEVESKPYSQANPRQSQPHYPPPALPRLPHAPGPAQYIAYEPAALPSESGDGLYRTRAGNDSVGNYAWESTVPSFPPSGPHHNEEHYARSYTESPTALTGENPNYQASGMPYLSLSSGPGHPPSASAPLAYDNRSHPPLYPPPSPPDNSSSIGSYAGPYNAAANRQASLDSGYPQERQASKERQWQDYSHPHPQQSYSPSPQLSITIKQHQHQHHYHHYSESSDYVRGPTTRAIPQNANVSTSGRSDYLHQQYVFPEDRTSRRGEMDLNSSPELHYSGSIHHSEQDHRHPHTDIPPHFSSSHSQSSSGYQSYDEQGITGYSSGYHPSGYAYNGADPMLGESGSPQKTPNDSTDLSYGGPPVKPKRRRADAAQLRVLNEVYARTAFPSTEERAQLGQRLGMSPRQVQIWFQNRRQNARGRASSAPQVVSTDNPGSSGSPSFSVSQSTSQYMVQGASTHDFKDDDDLESSQYVSREGYVKSELPSPPKDHYYSGR